MTIKAKKSKINLREKLAELLNFRQIRDRLDGLGLYLGKDRTGTTENVSVRGGANVDDLQLAEISAAVGGTAVDVFVYDTRNDSDGGKWRERTQHTSWYNEELNTATRGGRREFPAVAVIVAEASKVTIYDGDDPDLSMWMVFEGQFTADLKNCKLVCWANNPGGMTSCSFLNGLLGVGTGDNGGLIAINFVKDFSRYYRTEDSSYTGAIYSGNISTRNTLNHSWVGDYNQFGIVNDYVNDVAMTVLPNAPIDSETGLPIPTIAVATDGGVSVIRDDGSVVSGTSVYGRAKITTIGLTETRIYGTSQSGSNEGDSVFFSQPITLPFPEGANTRYPFFVSSDAALQLSSLLDINAVKHIISNDGKAIGGNLSLGLLDEQIQDPTKGMLCAISSSYNTGWMPGDIKLATLSDSTVETVGVDESAELVTNSEFTTDSDWTKPVEWTIPGDGTAVASNASSTLYQIVDNLTIGQTYKISINVLTITNGSVSWRAASIGQGGSLDLFASYSNTGVHEIVFKADATSMVIGVIGISSFSGTIGSVSLTKTGELITNGTFDDDIDWTKGSGWTISGGVATHAGTSFTTIQPTTSIGLINGKKYTYTIDTTGTGNIYFYYNGDSNYHTLNGGGSFVGTFTAGGYPSIKIGTSGDGYTVDNISVRLAEDDRSVNNNGLQVFGQIDKTSVAPGADLVAYSGFSADDYLMQPYNSDLDFGTGDFCIMGWIKLNSAPYGTSVGCVAAISDTSLKFYLNITHATGVFGLSLSGSTRITSETTAQAGSWAFVVAKRTSGELSISVNGQKNANDVTYADAINITSNQITSIGYRLINTDAELNGSLALLRISKTAPTDAQIAKIYRDEKVLFQDGAQATLYGTSDAVTALAYDDKTELLHVGTSSGRSDFAGLRRINNTTTAVTTSISASNNLIAEQ